MACARDIDIPRLIFLSKVSALKASVIPGRYQFVSLDVNVARALRTENGLSDATKRAGLATGKDGHTGRERR